MERRLLTAPEAALLIAPTAQTATQCVQAGLLALVGAGRISFEAGSRLSGPTLVLAPVAPDHGQELPGHLGALEQALLGYGKGRRLGSTQVVHALQKNFGAGYAGYVHDQVAVSLARRGLLLRTQSKWLGLFTRIQYTRTAQGEALVAPLARLMSALEQVPSLLETDPDKAIGLARSAGVLLIMVPNARKHIAALRRLVLARGDDFALPYVPLDEDQPSKLDVLLDLGDMALTFDIDGLLGAVDTVGDFTADGDSSSSDGGGDGGGGD